MCGDSSGRCSQCTFYRKTLRAYHSRKVHTTQQGEAPTTPSSCVNYRFLNPEQLQICLRNIHSQQCVTTQKLNRLPTKIAECVDVNENLHKDISTIMSECAENALSCHAPDSFAHVFWQQQVQAASVSHSSQRRYHPLMIKWALYLRHQSSRLTICCDSGCIALPSQRTLRDYTYFLQSSVSFSSDVDQHLMHAWRQPKSALFLTTRSVLI